MIYVNNILNSYFTHKNGTTLYIGDYFKTGSSEWYYVVSISLSMKTIFYNSYNKISSDYTSGPYPISFKGLDKLTVNKLSKNDIPE